MSGTYPQKSEFLLCRNPKMWVVSTLLGAVAPAALASPGYDSAVLPVQKDEPIGGLRMQVMPSASHTPPTGAIISPERAFLQSRKNSNSFLLSPFCEHAVDRWSMLSDDYPQRMGINLVEY